jgi:hypothetical protein
VPHRLLPAVELGFGPLLSRYGFVASGGGGARGETVECTNGTTLITVSADWLEGELALTVRSAGEAEMSIAEVIDLARVEALHLSRLSRSASTETVAAQLRKIAEALVEQAAELLGRAG